MNSVLISCLKIIRAKKGYLRRFSDFIFFLPKLSFTVSSCPVNSVIADQKEYCRVKVLVQLMWGFELMVPPSIMSRCALTLCASAWSRGTWWWTRGWPLGWRTRARKAAPRTHHLDDRMIKYILNERAGRQNNMRAEVASRLKIIKYVLYMYIFKRKTSLWPSLSFGLLVCWSVCLS